MILATTEPGLSIEDSGQIFTRHRAFILTTTIVGMLLGAAAGFLLPKKYKVHFTLTIYSKYFQSPLIGDFVPQLPESGELKSEREALIRQILSPDYLDVLGQKYHLYRPASDDRMPRLEKWMSDLKTLAVDMGLATPANRESLLTAEREELRSHIEIFSLNNTTFEVGFLYSDPAIAYRVTRDLYQELIRSLLAVRLHTISDVRDAIAKRVDGLSADTDSLDLAETATPIQRTAAELATVRRELRNLRLHNPENSMLVVQYRDRANILQSRLDTLRTAPTFAEESGPGDHETASGARDLTDDLRKKLNYLNIAMEADEQHRDDYFAALESPLFPSAPLWPKKGLFMFWGMAMGFFASFSVAAVREHSHRRRLEAGTLAHCFNLPLLAELPSVPLRATFPPALIGTSPKKELAAGH